MQRAKCHLHGISWLERPYHCPKAGVLKLWMYFLSQCKTLSPLKEKKTLTNAAWSFLQSTKGVFGCLFLFAQLSQHGVGIHCFFLAFLERGKKMGLAQDVSILWIQTKELRTVLAATPTSDCVLFYSSIKNSWWETLPKVSLDNLRELSSIIKAQIFFCRIPGASKYFLSTAINSLDCNLLT